MSQLIELVWRNRAYVEAMKDPELGFPNRKGAMFAGFSSEMGFENETGKPSKKPRQEVASYDRVCVYPGMCMDNKYTYNIGPQFGCDPASLDLPYNLQIPRTVRTSTFTSTRQLSVEPAKYHSSVDEVQGHEKLDETGKPAYFKEPGMTIRKRGKFSTDASAVVDVNSYAALSYVDDIDYANAGDTSVSIDLNESVSGVTAILKKVVIQCSKENHHISEVVIDFSDITRGSGSISSSAAPRSNLLTILMDGKTKMHEAYFDCKMGKFGANKFKLGVADVNYFPPMATPAGGFDAGSQIAVPGDIVFDVDGNHNSRNALAQIPTQTTQAGSGRVRDAVNAGYFIGASNHAESGDNVNEQTGTIQRDGDNQQSINNTQYEDVSAVLWKTPGVSHYTFKPREPRGTILAINVVLQADSNSF